MIFFVRHGERADQCDLPQEYKHIEREYDPHLTKVGQQQAAKTGLFINQLIKDHAIKHGLKLEDIKITCMVSPYLRCVTTARYLLQSLDNNPNEMYLQEELAELQYTYDFDKNMLKELHMRNRPIEQLEKYLQLGNQMKVYQERFYNNNKLVQPKFPENHNSSLLRISTFTKLLLEHYQQQDITKNIYICVTHQGAVEHALTTMKVNHGYIDYCGVGQIVFDLQTMAVSVPIKGQHFWK